MSKDTSRHIHHVPANGGPCISYTGNSINLKLTAEESSGELTVLDVAGRLLAIAKIVDGLLIPTKVLATS